MKSWGGIEGKIVTLCDEFLRQGIAVELLLPRGGEVPYPDRLKRDVDIVDLKSAGKLSTARKLARHLRAQPLDCLLVAKDHAIKAAIIARYLANSDIPIYIKVTNTPSLTLRRPAKRWLARWLYPRASGAIAVSEAVREDFLRDFSFAPGRVTTIYNPTIPPDFARRASAPAPHAWLNDTSIPVIMGVGRLTEQKGFDILLVAFSKLRAERNARLIIVGDGPMRGALQEKARALGIEDTTDFVGSTADALPWLSRASVYVLSSRWEGLPNVLIEALATKTPVIATDCPSGPREILEDGQLGRLVPVDDPSSMAESLSEVLESPSPAPFLEQSLTRFNSDIVAQRYLNFMGLNRNCN